MVQRLLQNYRLGLLNKTHEYELRYAKNGGYGNFLRILGWRLVPAACCPSSDIMLLFGADGLQTPKPLLRYTATIPYSNGFVNLAGCEISGTYPLIRLPKLI